MNNPSPRFAEMFIAAKGVFGEYKQHPQIVAKGTSYIFALHLEPVCPYL